MWNRRLAAGLATAAIGAAAACELAEVVTPDLDEVLVVEAVLRPELRRQRVLLHHSLRGGAVRPAPNVSVRIRDEETGEVHRLFATERIELCLGEIQELALPAEVTCYVSQQTEQSWVVPGHAYTLRLRTPGGEEANGRTVVPHAFELRNPSLESDSVCRLDPDRRLPIVWSRSPGAWAYINELEISNLKLALPDLEIDSVPDRVRLSGVAISDTDTTMVLPSDFGVFQRTQQEPELLIALRDGLPSGSVAKLAVAAVDRNYVNGVRGGIFNPSGRVRVSSVHGAAVGVFGSATARRILIQVGVAGGTPCE